MDFYKHNRSNIEHILSRVSYYSLDNITCTEDALEMLRSLVSLRHDLLQCLICEQLCLTAHLGVGDPIYKTMGLDEVDVLRFTPDIYVFQDGIHTFIDPGISKDPVSYEIQKTLKYEPAIKYLNSQGLKCRFIPICVSPDLSDIEVCLKGTVPWPPDESILTFFKDCYNLLWDSINLCKPLCPEGAIKSETQSDVFFTEHLDESILLSSQANSGAGLNQLNVEYPSIEEFEKIFYELVEDEEVRDLLSDKPIDKDTYKSNFIETISKADHDDLHVKPSFHIPYAPEIEITPNPKYSSFDRDQSNCLTILSKFCELYQDEKILFLRSILKKTETALSCEGDRNMFNRDCYTGDFDKEFKLKQNKPKEISMRKYLESLGIELRDSKPRVVKGRIVSLGKLDEGLSFLYHSGVNYSRHLGPRVYKKPRDCPSNSYQVFDDFYNRVCEPTLKPLKIDPLINFKPGMDSEASNLIKENAISYFTEFHNNISRTNVYRMALHSSIVARSLIHFNNLNTKECDFAFINSGLKNVCHIMHGGKRNKGNDVGNPFLTLVITNDSFWANNVFGSHTTYTSGGYYYIIYNWRRLSSNRLSFISDSFLSCQSTGFDTYLRTGKIGMGKEDLKKVYGFRALVSMCTTQRLAEVLMDIRYLCMSFISDFSDVAGLIKEKFSPRYPNCFVYWVVVNIANKVDELIHDYNQPGNIIKKMAVYSMQRRLQDSTGGDINILSIWSKTRLTNLQDLLDELFVYCHTMKEPSSIFHEFKKCFQTIFEYQRSFDIMPENMKYGKYNTSSQLKEWLMKIKRKEIKPMGCWDAACYHSAKQITEIRSNRLFSSKLKRETQMEPISEIVSTKACIPEYRLIETENESKKEKKQTRTQ